MSIGTRRRPLDRPHLVRLVPLAVAMALAACGGSSNDGQPSASTGNDPVAVDDRGTGDTSGNDGNGSQGTGNGGADGGSGSGATDGANQGSGDGGTSDDGNGNAGADQTGQALISWPVVPGADGYKVYYGQDATFDAGTATLLNSVVGPISGTTAAISDLKVGTTYNAWVAPVTAGVEGTVTSIGTFQPVADGFHAVAKQIRPNLNAIEVSSQQPIRIPFSVALDLTTVDTTAVSVAVDGADLPITLSTADNGKTLVIEPQSGAWQTAKSHRVRVAGTVRSDVGDSLGDALDYRFDTVDPTSLVAWWEFDNALTDLSGNGHTIGENNGVTFSDGDSEFRSGSHAAYFGTSSTLKLDEAGFDFGDKFAVAFWLYVPEIQSGINTILSNVGTPVTSNGFKIGVNSDAKNLRAIVEAGDGTVGGKAVTPSNTVKQGGWYYVVYNVDTTADLPNGKHVQIFVDGTEASVSYSGDGASINWANVKTTGPVTFGNMPTGSYRLRKAYLDDLRIYKQPLTSEAVTNMSR